MAELPDLRLGQGALGDLRDLIPAGVRALQQGGAVLVLHRLLQGELPTVAALLAVVVDEPVAYAGGGQAEKAAPPGLVAHHGLVEGQHGDAQFVVAIHGGPLQKFCGLRPDEGQVLPDQRIRRLGIILGLLDPAYNVMFIPHGITLLMQTTDVPDQNRGIPVAVNKIASSV